MKKILQSPFALLIAVILAVVAGYFDIAVMQKAAFVISDIFMRLLKLVSLPVIFFSIMSTITGIGQWSHIKTMGRKIVQYTILTTLVSASLALGLYMLLKPTITNVTHPTVALPVHETGYMEALLNIIPSNIIQPFVEHNVIAVLFIAVMFSFAILSLPDEKRMPVHAVVAGLFEAVMQIIRWIVLFMPIAVWAFITIFVEEVRKGLNFSDLGTYIIVIVAANLIQASIVLTTLLKSKGISPTMAFKGMFPALSLAFFSKSSAAAMPLAIDCAEKLGVKKRVARFSFPLCTTINMNACAAFIIVTVLFVAESNGVHLSIIDKIIWIVIATIAAIGNAGVPMGCFFLAGALLTTMGVPLVLMGVILPFYSLLDMLESAINIWSDACVTLVVDKES